jgi:hypothetical protein
MPGTPPIKAPGKGPDVRTHQETSIIERLTEPLAAIAHDLSVDSRSFHVCPAASSYAVFAPDVATLLWTRPASGDVTFTSRLRKRLERIEPRTYSADASVDHTSITPKRATTSLAASVDPIAPGKLGTGG